MTNRQLVDDFVKVYGQANYLTGDLNEDELYLVRLFVVAGYLWIDDKGYIRKVDRDD